MVAAQDLNIIAIFTAMVLGTASAMIYEPVVWLTMLASGILGVLRRSWLWLMPTAIVVEGILTWWAADYRRKIGVSAYPDLFKIIVNFTAMFILCYAAWIVLRLISRNK